MLLRGVHADEVDIAELAGLLPGGGESQPPAGPLEPGDVPPQQLLQPRLVHRHPALREHLDLLGNDVQPQHVEAEFGHGGRVRGPEVSGADHGDLGGHEYSNMRTG